MHFDISEIDNNFPKENYRPGQREAIEFTCNAFNEGKKFVILECPTGSGKSPIGITLANMVDRSYYLTITKILQDQLSNDFENVIQLKGRGSYPCTYWDRFGAKLVDRRLLSADLLSEYVKNNSTCDTGFCKTRLNNAPSKFKCSKCFTVGSSIGDLPELSGDKLHSECPYYEQLNRALYGSQVVMNFSSFLYQIQTKTFSSQLPRDLMIIDEAHQTEPELLDFVSLTISDRHLTGEGIFVPDLSSPEDYLSWFVDAQLHKAISNVAQDAMKNEQLHLVNEMRQMLSKYAKFKEGVEAGEEWVCEYRVVKNKNGTELFRSVDLKPVFANNIANDLLFKHADHVVMMSATILNAKIISKSLGIEDEDLAAYRMNNRFPKENRPIFLSRIGKMTGGKGRMHEWAPNMVAEIEDICEKYKGKRGIIHTHNFAIMDYILDNIEDSIRSRLIHQRDYNTKQELLEFHSKSDDTILIAPAMHEGIDLHGDLGRFAIICKVPYPNCFDDKQLARRVEVDRRYYQWLTAIKMVQSYGRCVRSVGDYADTYILDSSIDRFMAENRKLIPNWFSEAIKS